MNNPAAAFLTILEIELKDLEDDIQVIMADSEVKHHHDEISHYVYMENLALLKKEIFGVDGILTRVSSLNPANFGTSDEISDLLLGDLEDKVKRGLFPPVLLSLVKRKFNKVNTYIAQI